MIRNIVLEFDSKYHKNLEKNALIDGDKKISFKSLAQDSMILGYYILKNFNKIKNSPVAVFLPKCKELVVADIGVAYSGNFFMNLDIKLPKSRLKNIIDLIEPNILVTTREYFEEVKFLDVNVLLIDDVIETNTFNDSIHDCLISQLETMIDTDPFCIINTSGSTGTPKGVVLNHRSFFDFHNWALETFNFNGNEIIGSLSPAVFDIYDFELSMLMLSGSTMVLLDSNLAIFPVRLLEQVQKNSVNFIFWVPTIMVNIANKDLLSKVDLTCLKTVWFAGEVFPTKQFNYWRKKLSGAVFVNLYGPIEITLDCTYYIASEVLDDDEPLPIGRPCKNTDILLLNDEDKLCSVGEIGELCVRGTSLALGYYNNPEKTQSAFVQNPLNSAYPEIIYRTGDLAYWDDRGLIMFKGRKDSLVKHMGYRIELGEIEHIAVNTLKLVPNCCVVYNINAKAITMILEMSENVDIREIKKVLMDHLPRYMVPTTYIEMEQLPRNTNGKIDRLKLSNMVNCKC